jgi:serine/threonine-protein kinase
MSPGHDIKPGDCLGSYQIDGPAGRGGMRMVFRARDLRLQRPVALKVLVSPAAGETARTQLLREVRNAAALSHPNLCTIHEVGETRGRAFIASA